MYKDLTRFKTKDKNESEVTMMIERGRAWKPEKG